MLASHRIRLALTLTPLLAGPAFAWDDCRFTAERSVSVDTAGAARIEIAARAGDLALRPSTTKVLAAHGRACASSEEILSQVNVQARRNGDVVRVYVEVPDPIEEARATATPGSTSGSRCRPASRCRSSTAAAT